VPRLVDDAGTRPTPGAGRRVSALRSTTGAEGCVFTSGSTFMVVTGAGALTRAERLTSNVTRSTAFAPSTPSSTHTHHRGRLAKKIGRATVCTVTAPRSFSSSARLSAS
jgi:hypothetical protein